MANLFDIAKEKGVIPKDESKDSPSTKDSEKKVSSKKVGNSFTMRRLAFDESSKNVVNKSELSSKRAVKESETSSKNVVNKLVESSKSPVNKLESKKEISSRKNVVNKSVVSSKRAVKNPEYLTGWQQKVFFYLCQQAQFHGSSIDGYRLTPQIRTNELILALGIEKKRNANFVIYELNAGKLIEKHFLKRGPSGFAIYKIPEDFYKTYLRLDENQRAEVSSKNVVNKLESMLEMAPSSKLVNLNNKTDKQTRELIGDFQKIQTPEFLKNCSFGKAQLLQIQEAGILSASEVQESLEHFVADYEQGKLNIKTNPLAYLMGILRKQAYISASYLDDQRKEQEVYLAKVKASKRAEEEMRKILFQKAFEEWEKDLSQEEKAQYVEYNDFVKVGTEFETVMLRGYFEKNIYNQQEGENANTPD